MESIFSSISLPV